MGKGGDLGSLAPPSASSPATPDPTPLRPTAVVPDPRDDAELVAAHVGGDPYAFAVLVGRHRDRLWAIALRVMRNPDDAADALQDAYIAAFRRADTFRGDARVTTWLHRIVVNACLDRIRRQRTRAAEQPLPTTVDSVELGTTASRDPLEIQEERVAVAAALSHLNPDQRAALVLVDMEGYSVEEAAVVLGCAPGTVKSRCARGRARLLPLLSHLSGRALPGPELRDGGRG